MASTLQFNIVGNDRSQRAFASVSRSLSQTEGRLAAAQRKMRAFGAGMRNLGAVLSAGVTAPLALIARDSLKLFDEQQKAMAKVESAVRSTGGAAGFTARELAAMASGLQDLTTFGDEQILDEVTATLLTFTKIARDEFAQAQTAILDMATLLETDLRSAAIQVGKALNDPIKGVTALGRAGVQFSEDQKGMIRSLVEMGDVAGAQAVILKELNTQFGGQAAAAAQTNAGKIQQLANAYGDLKEEIGGVVSQYLMPVVDALRAGVKWFGALSPEVKKFTVVTAGIVAIGGPVVAALGLFVMAVSAISGPVLAVIAALTAATAAFLAFQEEIGAAIDWLANQVQTVLGEEIVGGVDSFAARVGESFNLLGRSVDAVIRGDLDAAWAHFKEGVLSLAGAILEPIQRVTQLFTEMGRKISETIVGMVDVIQKQVVERLRPVLESVGAAIAAVEAKFAWLYEQVVGNSWIPDMVDQVIDHMARMNEGMVTEASSAADKTSSVMEGMGAQITGELKSALMTGELSWRSFGESVLSIGMNLQSRLLDKVFKPLEDALSNYLDNLTTGLSAGAAGGGGLGGLLSTGLSFLGGLFGAADGAAFTRGGVAAFAGGGVVTSPTPFSFGAGQLGVMGEAGAEAIMPLKRGPDGKLGVAAAGSGGDRYELHIHGVPAQSVQGFRESEPELLAAWADKAAHARRRNR